MKLPNYMNNQDQFSFLVITLQFPGFSKKLLCQLYLHLWIPQSSTHLDILEKNYTYYSSKSSNLLFHPFALVLAKQNYLFEWEFEFVEQLGPTFLRMQNIQLLLRPVQLLRPKQYLQNLFDSYVLYYLLKFNSMIKKFSSPKMQNRQFIFAPKIQYQLVAERSEANPNRLQFPTWCPRWDSNPEKEIRTLSVYPISLRRRKR